MPAVGAYRDTNRTELKDLRYFSAASTIQSQLKAICIPRFQKLANHCLRYSTVMEIHTLNMHIDVSKQRQSSRDITNTHTSTKYLLKLSNLSTRPPFPLLESVSFAVVDECSLQTVAFAETLRRQEEKHGRGCRRRKVYKSINDCLVLFLLVVQQLVEMIRANRAVKLGHEVPRVCE